MKFNEILKQTRISQGLSQKQLAQKLNISESGYAHWEQGRTEPSTEYLKMLCLILHVSADYLIGLEQEDGSRSGEEIEYTTTSLKYRRK